MRVVFWLCFVFASQFALADPTKALFAALSEEDPAARVTAALDAGASANALNEQGQSPLHVLAFIGDFRAMEVLVTRGANVDLLNAQGQAALHIAAVDGHRNEFEELIRLGANLALLNAAGQTARQVAAAAYATRAAQAADRGEQLADRDEIDALFGEPRLAQLQAAGQQRRLAAQQQAEAEAEMRRANELQAAEQDRLLETWRRTQAEVEAQQVEIRREYGPEAEHQGAELAYWNQRARNRGNQGGWFTPFTLIPAAALVMFLVAQNRDGGSQ